MNKTPVLPNWQYHQSHGGISGTKPCGQHATLLRPGEGHSIPGWYKQYEPTVQQVPHGLHPTRTYLQARTILFAKRFPFLHNLRECYVLRNLSCRSLWWSGLWLSSEALQSTFFWTRNIWNSMLYGQGTFPRVPRFHVNILRLQLICHMAPLPVFLNYNYHYDNYYFALIVAYCFLCITLNNGSHIAVRNHKKY